MIPLSLSLTAGVPTWYVVAAAVTGGLLGLVAGAQSVYWNAHARGFRAGMLHAALGQRGHTITFDHGAVYIAAPSDRHAAEMLVRVVAATTRGAND